MANDPFGTAINCIDGRAQRPVADWVATYGQVKFVDMITEPGADGVIARGSSERLPQIRQAVEISVVAHNSTILAIAGHDGCAAHPVSEDEHKADIRKAAQVIAGWGLPVRIVGLWVDSWRQVEVVCDSANSAV
ncbi:MAG TPA: carbonic anhydrase [Ktedonobacterales bacterium]|nr:carbonic anhydrase [Ktedonobacterales bacterium]